MTTFKTTICDRCKAHCHPDASTEMIVDKGTWKPWSHSHWDLCEACVKSLKKWKEHPHA